MIAGRRIQFSVIGTPAPKGSSRAMLSKAGKAVNVPYGSTTNERAQKSWAVDVADCAYRAMRGAPMFNGVPLFVNLTFRVVRPTGHAAKKGGLRPSAPAYPTTKPDIDKVARCTLDAMTGIVFDDDSRIVSLAVHKVYAEEGQPPGASILVAERASTRTQEGESKR